MHEFLSARSTASFRAGAVSLIILAALVYIPSLGNGFVWDDGDNVAQKATLTGLHGLQRVWTDPLANQQYYPFTHTFFWLGYTLWGLAPLPYHASNILLLALSSVFILAILRRLQAPGALIAAALFVVHPVNVESVAWVTEFKNLLSGAFFFSSGLVYLTYSGVGDKLDSGQIRKPRRAAYYWLSLGLFICALLSKSATCPLPLALLLILWWKKDRLRGRDVYPLVPFVIAAAAMGLVTTLLEKHLGASGSAWNLSLVEKTLVAGRALWFYAGKCFWPADIIFIYPRWSIDSAAIWQYAYPLAAVAALVGFWLSKYRIGKGPAAAAGYFVVMVAPALGFLNVYFARYSFVQDHFQYYGSIALMTLPAFVIAKLAGPQTRDGSRWLSILGMSLALVLLTTLGTISWGLQRNYLNEEVLWRATLKANPSAAIAHANLGRLLMERGDVEEAGAELKLAVHMGPELHEVWNNYATWLIISKRQAEAIPCLRKALALNPTYPQAAANLALAELQLGHVDMAGQAAERALQLDSSLPDAHNTLGIVMIQYGRIKQAIEHFEAAVRLAPGDAGYERNLDRARSMLPQGQPPTP